MNCREKHLNREEMVLLLDRELEAERAAQCRAHLIACEVCSTLFQETAGTLEQLDRIYQEESRWIRESPWQRAILQSRLRQDGNKKGRRWLLLHRPLIYSVAALLLLTLSAGWTYHSMWRRPSADFANWATPDPSLTPGATRTVDYSDICPAKDEDKDPVVPADEQQTVFDEYKVPPTARTQGFQIDYLINPQLGGTSDIHNLWPQPYQAITWNARAKDALEDRLHTMVCSRQLDLVEAQRELATDWISAYKKYFHTQVPLAEQASLSGMDDIAF